MSQSDGSQGSARPSRRRFLGAAGAIAANVAALPAGVGGLRRAVPSIPILRPAAQISASPVAVTVDAGATGVAIPDDFAGLGFERGTLNANNAGVAGYLFSPSNSTLVTLVRNMGLRNIRIGGGTVDQQIPAGTGPDGYTGVDNLFAFAAEAGVRVIYSLRLLNPQSSPIPALQTDDGQAAAHIWRRHRAQLHSFAIGNEPDWHSYHTSPGHPEDPRIYETVAGVPGSAYPSYLADWRSFAETVLQNAEGATISAPDTGCYNTGTFVPDPTSGVSWTAAFASSERGSRTVADVTTHYYVGGSYGQTTVPQAIANMLSTEWVEATEIGTQPAGADSTSTYTPYPWEYRYCAAPVLAAGLPCRLTESNDYLGGVPGASNAFASALWALDYMHWWARRGAAGVNFHNNQWIPTDTVIKDPGCGTTGCDSFQIAPKGYALKAFDLGGHGSVRPATVTGNADAVNLTAYAAAQPDALSVTIINKTQGRGSAGAAVTLSLDGFRAAVADAMVLTGGAPGDGTPLTATLGGAPITNDRPWSGTWTRLPAGPPGSISITVEPTTAVVLRIRGAYAGGQSSP